jgi:hypothetical protein
MSVPWDAGTAFVIGNHADYNGLQFLCVANSTGDDPSTDGGVHWQKIMPAGDGMVVSGSGQAYVLASGRVVGSFDSAMAAQAFLRGGR